MPQRIDIPEPEKAGALVLRAWLEGMPEHPQLRVRLVGRLDVTRDAQDTGAASTIEDALAFVHDWLTHFLSSASQRPGR